MRDLALSQLEDAYRKYLVEVRARWKGSLPRRIGTFRRLARFLAERRVRRASRISLDLIYDFLEGCARGRSRRHTKTEHGSVRSILRFLHFTGRLRNDLSRHLVAPCTWKLASVPDAFSDKEVTRVLIQTETDRPLPWQGNCYHPRLLQSSGPAPPAAGTQPAAAGGASVALTFDGHRNRPGPRRHPGPPSDEGAPRGAPRRPQETHAAATAGSRSAGREGLRREPNMILFLAVATA
jgi:hypothetical protein